MRKNEQFVIGSFAVAIFMAFRELSIFWKWVDPMFVSSPSRIAITAVAMFSDGAIYNDLRISGIEFIIGYVLAILVGIPLGIAMGWYGKING
ncbi:hypothetical protein ACWF5S_08595 [Peribacillus butanolivorans]|uniref:hypothetical protein n=1 Tax=Peribacillus butanolivorans TaxID=421767 RepID=UPI0036835512